MARLSEYRPKSKNVATGLETASNHPATTVVLYCNQLSHGNLNPRPTGVWLVTRPAGRGEGPPPPEISQTTGPISKFQTPFDSPVRELPVQGKKIDREVTDDVTGQVKVRIFDFSGLVTSASKISMLSREANESAWIVSLISVSIISCAL